MKANPGAQYEISIDDVPRTYRDRQGIALQTARFLKSRNPHSVVKLKDLQTGKETVVAFKIGPVIPMRLKMRPTGLHPGAGLSHGQHKDRHIWATNGTSVIGITSPIKFDPGLAP